MRFSDFLDEASPTVPPSTESRPSSPVTEPAPPELVNAMIGPAPAHQHVLGPPPIATGDVSAFAELFGAVPGNAASSTHPEVSAASPASLSVQEAIDAIVVPSNVGLASSQASPEAALTPEDPPEPTGSNEHVIDDDLLPSRSGRSPKIQPARAWSLGRSKR